MSDRARRGLIAVGLAVAVLIVFGRAAGYDFIELDDRGYVVDNAMVQHGLTGSGVAWAFTTFAEGNWHPLTWLSLMIDASIGGGSPGAFHAGNIVDHAVATVLLFLLLARLTGGEGCSATVALLFALHPLRVESVVWVSERKDVLSLALGFAALYAWVAWVEKASTGRYAASLGLFAAGLLAKPMLVSLPIVMLLLDRWPLDRFDLARGVREKAPFFALSGISAVVTFVAQWRSGAVSLLTVQPFPARLANALVSTMDYLIMTIWPRGLAMPYPLDIARISSLRVPIAAAAVAVLSALAVRAWAFRPHWAVGWAWYLVTLLPVIGIVQVGSQAMADRYTYLPMVGPVLAVVWEIGSRLPRSVSIALASVVVTLLSIATAAQAAYWRDTKTLFTHTVAVTRPNFVAHHALGRAAYREGRLDDSIAELRMAVSIAEHYAPAWAALGETLLKAGRNEEAIDAYRHALREGSDGSEVRSKLAAALAAEGTRRMRNGDDAGAENVLREAVATEPTDATAHGTLGVALARAGKLEDAERELAEAVRLDPSSAGFASNLERVRRLRQVR